MSHTNKTNDNTQIYTIAIDNNPVRKEHLIKLQKKSHYPDNHIKTYGYDNSPIKICATPTGIRWVYDNLVALGERFEKEDKNFEQNIAHKTAEIIYQRVKNDIKITCNLPASKHPSNTD